VLDIPPADATLDSSVYCYLSANPTDIQPLSEQSMVALGMSRWWDRTDVRPSYHHKKEDEYVILYFFSFFYRALTFSIFLSEEFCYFALLFKELRSQLEEIFAPIEAGEKGILEQIESCFLFPAPA
jgi:hypothetical protein